MHQLMWTPYWILAFWALWLYVTEGLCSHGCMSVYPFRSNVLYHASRRICQLEIFNHLSVKWSCDCDCLVLIVCVAAPTESPGDEQRGVQGLAQLEAGELEEIQRTFLKVWNRGMSWRHQRKHTGGCFIFFARLDATEAQELPPPELKLMESWGWMREVMKVWKMWWVNEECVLFVFAWVK